MLPRGVPGLRRLNGIVYLLLNAIVSGVASDECDMLCEVRCNSLHRRVLWCTSAYFGLEMEQSRLCTNF